MSNPLHYYKRRRTIKYFVAYDITIQTDIFPEKEILTPYCRLTVDGILTIFAGYGWDGATGIADIDAVKKASCVHDILYKLMRLGFLDYKKWKKPADLEFTKICKAALTEENKNKKTIKAFKLIKEACDSFYVWRNLKGLEWLGTYSCIPKVEENKIYIAP